MCKVRKAGRTGALFVTLVALASCARIVPSPPVTPPPPPVIEPPPPATAVEAGFAPGPQLFGLDANQAVEAYRAFQISCPSLVRRPDPSGLTMPEQWRAACDAAGGLVLDDVAAAAIDFFRNNFELVRVGEGKAFATGYYEPEIAGSRDRRPGYDVPVYAKPADLLDANPLTAAQGRGRIDETGQYVLYYDRGAIEDGALAGKGLEIAWAADPVDLFFLQIQGSGRLRQPDGTVMRIGYASQNGREYIAVGRLMRERGLLVSPVTMQAVRGWLKSHPDEGRALMRENKSYVFFRELTGAGPLGALGLPVTARATVAADPKFIPLGAPVLLAGMDNIQANGLWIAQDTGGAIKGANRVDTFWGAGAPAELTAGGMSARGQAYLLLPKGSLARLAALKGGDATAQR